MAEVRLSYTERQKIRIQKRMSKENDIKYRGILSYRGLRAIAWIALAIAQLLIIDKVWGVAFNNNGFLSLSGYDTISLFGEIATPLFLIATFSTILNRSKSYRNIFISYGFAVLGMAAAFILLFERYFASIIVYASSKTSSPVTWEQVSKGFANLFGTKLKVNIFVDLLLVTFFDFAINYDPKKCFQGKKIYIFRALAILPLLYAIFSQSLKFLHFTKVIELPFEVYPFLATKSPIYYLIFIFLAVFLKVRKNLYIKYGASKEQVMNYVKSNRNSLHFSCAISIIFLIAAVADLLLFYLVLRLTGGIITPSKGIYNTLPYALGLGETFGLLLSIPFVMLFSYTRTYKNTSFDIVLPFVGIGLIIFTYLEGFYQILIRLIK